MGLNKSFVGKTYPTHEFKVEREAIEAYARATNEDNPRLVGPGLEMASPMFAVVWLLPNTLDAIFDQELIADADVGRNVFSHQGLVFHKTVRPGDVLHTTTQVKSIEDKSSGENLTLTFESRDRSGELVVQAESSFFFRGPPDPNRIRKVTPATEIPATTLFAIRLHVDNDQTFRYAEASGDHNPIHVDEEMAKLMGFPGIIVHGLCSMALSHKAILEGACQGDPGRLKRIQVTFAKPVFPGDDLICTAWTVEKTGDRQRIGFVLKNPRGEEVLREGMAEVLG